MPYGQETYPVPHPATGSTTASTSPLLCATDPYAGRAKVRRRVLRPRDRAASAASSDPDVSPPKAQKTAEIARLTAVVRRSLADQRGGLRPPRTRPDRLYRSVVALNPGRGTFGPVHPWGSAADVRAWDWTRASVAGVRSNRRVRTPRFGLLCRFAPAIQNAINSVANGIAGVDAAGTAHQ